MYTIGLCLNGIMPKIRLGGKITTSHSTITDTAQVIVQLASKRSDVTKISVSIIKSVRGVRKSLKFKIMPSGLDTTVCGSGAVQKVFIYTKTPEVTAKELATDFIKKVK